MGMQGILVMPRFGVNMCSDLYGVLFAWKQGICCMRVVLFACFLVSNVYGITAKDSCRGCERRNQMTNR